MKWLEIYKRFEALPYRAQRLAYIGGMYTGGIVSFLLSEESEYKDIDIVVTAQNWRTVGEFVKEEFKGHEVTLNKFGGLRVCTDGTTYDIWPIGLLDYLSSEGKQDKQLWVLNFPARKLYHSVNLNV